MTSCYQRGELVKYGICVVRDVTRFDWNDYID